MSQNPGLVDPYAGGVRIRHDAPGQNNSQDILTPKFHSIFQREPYSMARRPSFGSWLRITWPDIFTMLIIGAIAIGLYHAPPFGTRMFPLTVINAFTGHETGEVDTVLVIVVPLFVFLVAQIRIASFWDFNNAIIGFIYALLTSSAFQVVIKWVIGGFRPNFYDVCKPNTSGLNGVGYMRYMYTSEVCTIKGRPLWNAMQSFPSGHSTTILAAGVYLYLYLNAKLKVFSNYHPSMWKLILLYLPILGAVLVCASLTLDHSHHWYDILAGAFIGITFAISAYRMVYASVWDWRVNHIPLNRVTAFTWSQGSEGSTATCTNRAGWGVAHTQSEKDTLPGPVTGNGSMNIPSTSRTSGSYVHHHHGNPGGANDHHLEHVNNSARTSEG